VEDIFDKIQKNRGPLGQFSKEAHGYFSFPRLEGEIGPRMKFRGKDVLNWSLNNYLGLANHPEVRKADAEAAAQYGMAYPMGARMMSGNSVEHEKLEADLATFVGKEDAFLINYGYQAMVSAIDALVDRHDVIVYDSESHACIIDGVRLHIGKRFVFAHNDIENLEKQLQHAQKIVHETKGGILVITEGVFGMAGDLGKLKEIAALKSKYKFRLLVDDAHGFGILGETGAGVGEELGVTKDIDIYFSTFAKSMAGIGGFIASDEQIIDFLKYNMRSQTFAKALPMPMVKGAQKRLELVKTQPHLRENLWKIVRALQADLRAEGFNLGRTESPVTPVILQGGVPDARGLIIDLRENYNLFCSVVAYPVVPKGIIMLRIIPTAVHTLEDVHETLSAFKSVSGKLKEGYYQKNDVVATV